MKQSSGGLLVCSKGYSFDLNALKKPADHSNAYYKVTSDTSEHDYYVNVCEPVSDTACSGQDIGACQVQKGDTRYSKTCYSYD